MAAINSRTSALRRGRPSRRCDLHVRYSRQPLRCQAITVSGRTILRWRAHPLGHKRRSQTKRSDPHCAESALAWCAGAPQAGGAERGSREQALGASATRLREREAPTQGSPPPPRQDISPPGREVRHPYPPRSRGLSDRLLPSYRVRTDPNSQGSNSSEASDSSSKIVSLRPDGARNEIWLGLFNTVRNSVLLPREVWVQSGR